MMSDYQTPRSPIGVAIRNARETINKLIDAETAPIEAIIATVKYCRELQALSRELIAKYEAQIAAENREDAVAFGWQKPDGEAINLEGVS
jgi:hypothetical protein